MADYKIRVPIKVVTPVPRDFEKPGPGRASSKVFDKVDDDTRSTFDTQLEEIGDHFADSFRKHPRVPAVAKAVLKPQALAKTHRPTDILNDNTCPVIGGGDFGEVLISVHPTGLRSLRSKVKGTTSEKGVANLSTIERFEPYDASAAFRGRSAAELAAAIAKTDRPLKVRLFSHRNSMADDAVRTAFLETARELGVGDREIAYSSSLTIHALSGADAEAVLAIGSFVGTQSVGTFPVFSPVRTAAKYLRGIEEADFPPPKSDVDYPVVGLVDTGVDPHNTLLEPWVVDRESFVPEHLADYRHGTFIAGLLAHGRFINGGSALFPNAPVRILDVAAIPGLGGIEEYELLAVLREVMGRHPGVKVWNISLASETPCIDGGFSDLGVAFDDLQDEFDCTIIVPTGNYRGTPRTWPSPTLGELDRMCPPADSVRALTVASVAHIDTSASCVRRNEPSPFSRRGPGPAFLPKPELAHYGGNMTRGGSFQQLGVVSLGLNNTVVEEVGTSYAVAPVSALLSNIHHAVKTPMSTALAKALTIHSAVLASSGLDPKSLHYRGFGVPGDAMEILYCTPWAASVIFEVELEPGLEFHKWPFPIPDCLRTDEDTVRGDFTMTLAYDPPLDQQFGSEYCRTNVEASFGTYDKDASGKRVHHGQLPPQPKDASKLQERHLIEHGFKWSPVKVYRRMIPRGIAGDVWRLAIHRSSRANYIYGGPQTAAVVLTMADPDQQAPVYDELIRAMTIAGWITNDLKVKSRSQYRVR